MNCISLSSVDRLLAKFLFVDNMRRMADTGSVVAQSTLAHIIGHDKI